MGLKDGAPKGWSPKESARLRQKIERRFPNGIDVSPEHTLPDTVPVISPDTASILSRVYLVDSEVRNNYVQEVMVQAPSPYNAGIMVGEQMSSMLEQNGSGQFLDALTKWGKSVYPNDEQYAASVEVGSMIVVKALSVQMETQFLEKMKRVNKDAWSKAFNSLGVDSGNIHSLVVRGRRNFKIPQIQEPLREFLHDFTTRWVSDNHFRPVRFGAIGTYMAIDHAWNRKVAQSPQTDSGK